MIGEQIIGRWVGAPPVGEGKGVELRTVCGLLRAARPFVAPPEAGGRRDARSYRHLSGRTIDWTTDLHDWKTAAKQNKTPGNFGGYKLNIDSNL